MKSHVDPNSRSDTPHLTFEQIAAILSHREGKRVFPQACKASEKRALEKIREALLPLWYEIFNK